MASEKNHNMYEVKMKLDVAIQLADIEIIFKALFKSVTFKHNGQQDIR